MSKILFSFKTKLRLGILCLSTAYGAPLQAQSLEQAVAMALDSHPDIRQSFARFKSKEEDVNQARAGYLPTIDLTAGYGAEYSDTPGNRRSSLGFADQDTTLNRSELGISLRQMIFDGMFTQNEVARTQYEASAQQWALISTAEDLALSVSQAYLNYLKTAQLITLAEKNVSSHEVIYAQIKERTDSGLGSIADLSQISGRLARAQSNLIAARNNNEDARVQFIRLTNTTPKELVKPVPDADMLPNDASSG
ncbi:MAG: adhesin transport system outer membrane protein, partial [Paraglaciecola sp.]